VDNVVSLNPSPRRRRLPTHGSGASDVLTVAETARLLGLNVNSTYGYLANGTIPGRRIGRRWIISRTAGCVARRNRDRRLMGWIVPTPAGTYRVNWRDPSGQQRAKTLPTKREAKAFLARVGADASRGTYVDPHAGRVLLREYAANWRAGRTVEARTQETTQAMLRTHVLPRWGDWPLTKIDHLSVQQWVAELATRRKPATVVAALGVLSMILGTAVRARLLPSNPCDGVRAPRRRADESPMQTITRDELHAKLLPAVPGRYRVLVCLAAGAGLRWVSARGWPGTQSTSTRVR
jgi:excisionase family DNA binding protein